MEFNEIMDAVSRIFEAVGIAVLVFGFFIGLYLAMRDLLRGKRGGAYDMIRTYFGQSILLGLEILVAADLIRTVVVAPTMQNLEVLGLLVLIRTFLSFSLEIEIEGIAPWRRWSLKTLGKPAPNPRNDSG
ncbi:MAG: DUF1622 domain-containing protein [Actinobacteria bacterium]|nr:DUF1622 domain-containing protein [Actinomycetota bacterium]